jgi:tetratricopeptide (TPR) repeat protein
MPTSADITKLGQMLPTLWIEEEIVDKAIAYLQTQPTDLKRWGGVAVDFRKAGKYYAADVTLQLALVRFPDEALLWHQRGLLFDAWQKDEAAIALFDRALQLDPLCGPALFGRARALKKQFRFFDAITAYELYLKLKPLSAAAQNDIGICYLALGRSDVALQHFAQAIELDPAGPNALFNTVATLYGMRQYDEAIEAVDYFLARWPGDLAAQDLRKKILLRPEEPDWISLEEERHQQLIIRGSPNYGWTGTASHPQFGMVEPDLSQTDILNVADILAMPPEKARGIVGYRTVDSVQFQKLFEEKLKEPRPANPPPKIFLSYRRAPADHAGWVRRLAEDIRARGYDVIFDEFVSENNAAMQVPELVALLATCTLFVPIITSDYALGVEPDGVHTDQYVALGVDEGSWVFDEYRMGLQLVRRRRARLAGFWREGFLFPCPLHEGNLIDFRDDQNYRHQIEDQFPQRK